MDEICRQVKEILLTGRSERAENLEHDPKTVAMKELKEVWGVGETKARALVQSGIMSVEDLRSVTVPPNKSQA